MISLTNLFIKHMDQREFDALSLRRSNLWHRALKASDPTERAVLLFGLVSLDERRESMAARLYGPQAASWYCDSVTILTYAALAERALHEACWTAAAALKADATIWRGGQPYYVIAVAGGEQIGGQPARIVLASRGPDGEVRQELAPSELVQTRPVLAGPAMRALTDGASLAEVDLWEQLAATPERTQRAALYRKLAQLPGFNGEPGAYQEVLEELALAEEHLAPGAPLHPDLVAAEREERRVRLSERTLLSAVIGTLLIFLTEGDGPLMWLAFLVGLACAVVCRFGLHEKAFRRRRTAR